MNAALIDQVVTLAAELAAARVEVARLEAELAALLGGGATKRVPREKPVGRVATAPAAGEGGKAAKSERAERVLELAKQGLSAAEIGTKLGVPGRVIHMSMWRPRKAGKLPKGEKSR